ncbi:MAG: V-type ATP synthase subunit F [Oscillospiraceae bacterium]|jgi:V/A-type H+-transporting ATPase subunit F|nr:V-type ATP synthase subunit F [Oscillospiraceae bacterium]
MRFFLISDNVDTIVGMKLAGIEGVLIHEDYEVEEALKNAIADKKVAIILITERLVNLCPKKIYELKLHTKRPLIIEIPDRHGNGRTKDSISTYVRDAIGLKI